MEKLFSSIHRRLLRRLLQEEEPERMGDESYSLGDDDDESCCCCCGYRKLLRAIFLPLSQFLSALIAADYF